MNNILKIKCMASDSLSIYKYNVKVFNENNDLIVNDYTDKYGDYYFDYSNCGVYAIQVSSCFLYPYKKTIVILINNNKEITFSFSKNNYNHPVTIKLIDQNYNGLPIEKGRMILWKINK